jgi:hypothetical protein
MSTSHALLTRWAGSLVAALAFLAWLLAMAGLWMKFGLVNHLIMDGIKDSVMVGFAVKSLLSEILPLYLGYGFLLFVLAMTVAKALRIWTPERDTWAFRHAFWSTLGLIGLAHAWLWWQVPTSLWVYLGINRLPMGPALVLIFLACAVGAWKGLAWSRAGRARKGAAIGVWFALAWGAVWLPQHLEQMIWSNEKPAGHPAKVVMISLDGLRQDTAIKVGFANAHGFKSFNTYAALPATRLEWSILWGGDPRKYSVGNLIPSIDELEGHAPYEVLEAAKLKGLKARFYIDDGGTVGLSDRTAAFDEVGMPASGWENFLNSNLAVHLPLYAAWMNVLRIFPTTTPWTPVDLGIRAALDRGRGADWVMYHSCLDHQPIFLNRAELASIPGWWKLPSANMAPHFGEPSPAQERSWRPEYSPFLAYEIRVKDILDHWITIWNGLPSDPDYGPASRFLMTDHGERFYHVTDDIQLGGIHGYNLDPWEARIPLCLDGPGVEEGVDQSRAVSLLTVRDLVARRVLEDAPVKPTDLLAPDNAPLRMNAINFALHSDDPKDYLETDPEEIIEGAIVRPSGVWVMRYKAGIEEREKDLTYGQASGRTLKIYRPLKKGGCRLFIYGGYDLLSVQELTQSAFDGVKLSINTAFTKPWNSPHLK